MLEKSPVKDFLQALRTSSVDPENIRWILFFPLVFLVVMRYQENPKKIQEEFQQMTKALTDQGHRDVADSLRLLLSFMSQPKQTAVQEKLDTVIKELLAGCLEPFGSSPAK